MDHKCYCAGLLAELESPNDQGNKLTYLRHSWTRHCLSHSFISSWNRESILSLVQNQSKTSSPYITKNGKQKRCQLYSLRSKGFRTARVAAVSLIGSASDQKSGAYCYTKASEQAASASRVRTKSAEVRRGRARRGRGWREKGITLFLCSLIFSLVPFAWFFWKHLLHRLLLVQSRAFSHSDRMWIGARAKRRQGRRWWGWKTMTTN